MHSLEIILESVPFKAAHEVWGMLSTKHELFKLDKLFDESSTEVVSSDEFLLKLRKLNPQSFRLKIGQGEVSYNYLAHSSLARINISNLVKEHSGADKLIDKFLEENILIQARLYDSEYDYWQNASDMLVYKVHSRDLDGVAIISNGLPYPLTEEVVDVSRNPGRSILKNGFIEFVGSTMWVGDSFWRLSGMSKEFFMSNADFYKREVAGYIQIRALNHPFTKQDGVEARIQERIRFLLYEQKNGSGL